MNKITANKLLVNLTVLLGRQELGEHALPLTEEIPEILTAAPAPDTAASADRQTFSGHPGDIVVVVTEGSSLRGWAPASVTSVAASEFSIAPLLCVSQDRLQWELPMEPDVLTLSQLTQKGSCCP